MPLYFCSFNASCSDSTSFTAGELNIKLMKYLLDQLFLYYLAVCQRFNKGPEDEGRTWKALIS